MTHLELDRGEKSDSKNREFREEHSFQSIAKVFAFRVNKNPGGVQETVEKAMTPIWKERLLKGSRVFVKVNLISSEFVPGQCTSPLVLDEVLKEITERGYDVVFGDADLAAAKQCDRAAEVWGHKRLAEKYKARFQNLSKCRLIKAKIGGKIFKTLDIPEVVYNADHIISLPVMKTHCLTGITCALKHFWGIVPRVRHQYHLVVDEAIADITQFVKPKLAFTIADGTVAMEGEGPRTGKPKICDIVMSSKDPVALDAAVAEYMGISIPTHVFAASKRGTGTHRFAKVGYNFESNSFEQAKPDKQPIFKWEMALRKTRLKPIIFDTSLFEVFAFIATKYNSFWYYQRKGKGYAKKIMKTWYGKEISKFVEYTHEEN